MGTEPSTSWLTTAGLSQLLAFGTDVNHLVGVPARPHGRPVGVGLLGLQRALRPGTEAAALTAGRRNEDKMT